MRRVHETDSQDQASGASDSLLLPFDGGYLTDGETLFHIERTLIDDPHGGELLVELEDCGTLELIVCSARSMGELGLRPVQPLVRTAS